MSKALEVIDNELMGLGGFIPEVHSPETADAAVVYQKTVVQTEKFKIKKILDKVKQYKADVDFIEAGTDKVLLEYTQEYFKIEGVKNLYCEKAQCNLKIHLSPGAVEITDINLIPPEYTEVKIVPIINKINEALKAGINITGARLVKKPVLTKPRVKPKE